MLARKAKEEILFGMDVFSPSEEHAMPA